MIIKTILFIIALLTTGAPVISKAPTTIHTINKVIYTEQDSNFNTYYPVVSFGGTLSTFTSSHILAYLNQEHTIYVEQEAFNGTYLILYLKSQANSYYLARYQYSNYTYTRATYGNESDGYQGILNIDYIETLNNTNSVYMFNYYFTETPNDLSQLPKNYKYYVSNVSGNDEYSIGFEDGQNKGYTQGYNQGYDNGTTNGINDVLNNLENYDLYTEQEYLEYGTTKYNQGYTTGLDEATDNDFTMWGLISSIMTAPALLIKESLNFNFFGINVANIVFFLITISIVVFIIGIFKKK